MYDFYISFQKVMYDFYISFQRALLLQPTHKSSDLLKRTDSVLDKRLPNRLLTRILLVNLDSSVYSTRQRRRGGEGVVVGVTNHKKKRGC